MEELKGSIKYINDDIMSLLMKQSGYTREADGYYKNRKSEFSSACSSNKEKYFIAVNQIEEKADCLYGNINEQNDILQNVYLLNKRITSLLFQSNNFKPELIEIINILTDSLINRNSCYLKSGDNFKFVDLEDIFNDNGDLEVNELEIINNKIEDFYCYLTDLEDNLFGLSE